MLITNRLEVEQPLEAVWDFFGNIPQVAACLPGTNLTDQIGDDQYVGDVIIKAGPVKLEFTGRAEIQKRDVASRTIVVDQKAVNTSAAASAAATAPGSLDSVRSRSPPMLRVHSNTHTNTHAGIHIITCPSRRRWHTTGHRHPG